MRKRGIGWAIALGALFALPTGCREKPPDPNDPNLKTIALKGRPHLPGKGGASGATTRRIKLPNS